MQDLPLSIIFKQETQKGLFSFKTTERIEFKGINEKVHTLAIDSNKTYEKIPERSLLNTLSNWRWVFIKIFDNNQPCYIKVNAASLRKHFNISKDEFADWHGGDATQLVRNQLHQVAKNNQLHAYLFNEALASEEYPEAFALYSKLERPLNLQASDINSVKLEKFYQSDHFIEKADSDSLEEGISFLTNLKLEDESPLNPLYAKLYEEKGDKETNIQEKLENYQKARDYYKEGEPENKKVKAIAQKISSTKLNQALAKESLEEAFELYSKLERPLNLQASDINSVKLEEFYRSDLFLKKANLVSLEEAISFLTTLKLKDEGPLNRLYVRAGQLYEQRGDEEKNLQNKREDYKKAEKYGREVSQKILQIDFETYIGNVQEGTPESIEKLYSFAVYCQKLERDPKSLTFQSYQFAAEKGYAPAFIPLGHCYYLGIGTASDDQKALENYIKAAEKGQEAAFEEIKQIVLQHSFEVRKEPDFLSKNYDPIENRALEALVKYYPTKITSLLEDYQRKNFIESIYNLGEYLLRKKLYDQAFLCFEKAASLKHPKAAAPLLIELGHSHLKENKQELAIKYYEVAANQGNEEALLALGNLYQKRAVGSSERLWTAYQYYKKAIGMGYEKGFECLKKLQEQCTQAALNKLLEEKNQKNKEQLLIIAQECQKDLASAPLIMGDFYKEKQQFSKAFEFYKKAIEMGNTQGVERLKELIKEVEQQFSLKKESEPIDQKLLNLALQCYREIVFINPEENLNEEFSLSFQIANKDPNFTSLLGDFYREKQQFSKAFEFYKKAIEIGNNQGIEGLKELAKRIESKFQEEPLNQELLNIAWQCNELNSINSEENEIFPFRYFQTALKNQSIEAFQTLGDFYKKKNDLAKFYQLCKNLIDLNNTADPKFIKALGDIILSITKGLSDLDIVKACLELAFRCFEKAAKLNEPAALLMMGYCYQFGFCTEINVKKAKDYYHRLIADPIDSQMTPSPLETPLPIEIKGEAYYRLGQIYEFGKTEDFNLRSDELLKKIAVKYYAFARENGNSLAQEALNRLGSTNS